MFSFCFVFLFFFFFGEHVFKVTEDNDSLERNVALFHRSIFLKNFSSRKIIESFSVSIDCHTMFT